MKPNIKEKLQKIDKDYYTLLQSIGKIAKEEKLLAYLVGGMVRDLLLGVNNLDIDIVVENNAQLLAETLVKKLPGSELSAKHDRFHTAKVIINANGKKIPVDLASTRQEIYEYPAALPQVRISDLKKDLYRRDFTINALAVSILPLDFGEVVDLFDGLIDLKNKKIKILHDLSFIDDPTRIIRAIRFAERLDFQVEEYTQKLLKQAIDSKQFDNLIEKIRGDRVKIEIRYLFNLPNIEQAVESFFGSGMSRMISTSLVLSDEITETISKSKYFIAKEKSDKKWLIYLGLVMQDLKTSEQNKIMNNLQLSGDEIKIIQNGFVAHNRLHTLLINQEPISSIIIYRELKGLHSESILTIKALFIQNPAMMDYINEFSEKTSKIKLEIKGEDLISLGIKEGKQIGEVLDKILEMKIKNPSMKKEDEMKAVEALRHKSSTT